MKTRKNTKVNREQTHRAFADSDNFVKGEQFKHIFGCSRFIDPVGAEVPVENFGPSESSVLAIRSEWLVIGVVRPWDANVLIRSDSR